MSTGFDPRTAYASDVKHLDYIDESIFTPKDQAGESEAGGLRVNVLEDDRRKKDFAGFQLAHSSVTTVLCIWPVDNMPMPKMGDQVRITRTGKVWVITATTNPDLGMYVCLATEARGYGGR